MQGTTPEINDINITVPGVDKLLSKLNPTKAAGPDNITPRVLKELAPFIAPILSHIQNIIRIRNYTSHMENSKHLSSI
jgi:hypothetical protein